MNEHICCATGSLTRLQTLFHGYRQFRPSTSLHGFRPRVQIQFAKTFELAAKHSKSDDGVDRQFTNLHLYNASLTLSQRSASSDVASTSLRSDSLDKLSTRRETSCRLQWRQRKRHEMPCRGRYQGVASFKLADSMCAHTQDRESSPRNKRGDEQDAAHSEQRESHRRDYSLM